MLGGLAMVGVAVTGDLDAVVASLSGHVEVAYVVMTAGGFDLLVELVCRDDAHLLEIVNGSIRALPQVLRAEIFIYLNIRRQTYNWST